MKRSMPSVSYADEKNRKRSWPSARAGPIETNCPLRRSLFLAPWHVLPQHFIDARLPAAPLLPECLQHVRVELQRLVDLSVRLRRPATAAAHQLLGRLFANKFPQHVRSGPRSGEIFLRPFGIVLVGARGPVIRRLFCHTVTARLFACPAQAHDVQILAARR